MTTPTQPPEPDERPREDVHRAVVRIVAGGIGEGIDRMMRVSKELDDADVEPNGDLSPFHADPNMMAFVGWVAELPELVRGLTESTSRMAYPVVQASGVVWNTAAYMAESSGLAPFVAGATEPLRSAIAAERERLTAVGTAEYARGRVLAVQAFEESVGGIIGLVSESEELGELVREQTLGITGSAVQEIRETGAAADGLTEGIFRRLLRREDRRLPPHSTAPAADS